MKLALLIVAALGTYLLARDHDVPAPLSAVAGVAAPLAGFTVYMDAPSWVTGLMAWAILPWAWRALRRLSRRESGCSGPFACSYLIVTIGYVHGTIMLAVLYMRRARRRPRHGQERRGLLSVLGCGALTALVTITVYLPSALTADVTVRAQRGITNSDFLSPDLAGIVSSVSPEALTRPTGWWPDGYAPRRSSYVAWFLPVLAFVDWSTARRHVAETVDLLVVLAVSLFFVLGPSDIGPLRFPVRLMPYVGTERHRARCRPPGAGARPAHQRRGG